ncbi:MAG: squalene--hopene cyclase [Elusimicrobiota bacterium]|nr:squalene--hopene cyclase [Elusimicrobiota bacterium]
MIKNMVSGWLTLGRDRKPADLLDSIKPEVRLASSSKETPERLSDAIRRSQDALLRMQNQEDGYWCGPIFGDTTIDSDTIMLLNFLGRGNSVKVRRLANHILNKQNADGGWPIYDNGPSEISATVKAYWALKFAGHSPNEPRLEAARKKIKALGGVHKANSYTKFYLALFGQYDWRGIPSIPPEIMLFPKWFYFNLYEMSAWTRPIVVPLSIVWAFQPQIPCPAHATIDELFPDTRRYIPLTEAVGPHSFVSWSTFFLMWDSFLKGMEGRGGHWIRVWSLRLAEDWILERLQDSDGPGAIFPPIVNAIMAMKCLGYPDTDPRLVALMQELDRLEVPSEDSTRYQPSRSPVWDTAIKMIALAESGLDRSHPALVQAAQWTISKEIKMRGDWSVTNPGGPTGGWHFQFNNPFYPDVDDTAMVLLALRHVHLEEPNAQIREKSFVRGLNWLMSMQSVTGGFAAFDKENTKQILEKIPFADHNAMIDPPTADITARVLELLGYCGYDASYPAAAKAIRFVKDEQESDGSWYGRWCVNYIYGTWQAVRGLAAIGENMNQPAIKRAVSWLKSVQLPNGGWGETCETYSDPSLKGKGPATPTQTAWAIMTLMAAGDYSSEALKKGVEHLVSTQRPDGTWDETEFTGTGFPKVYYLEYTMYRNNFPLQALGIYRKALAQNLVAS